MAGSIISLALGSAMVDGEMDVSARAGGLFLSTTTLDLTGLHRGYRTPRLPSHRRRTQPSTDRDHVRAKHPHVTPSTPSAIINRLDVFQLHDSSSSGRGKLGHNRDEKKVASIGGSAIPMTQWDLSCTSAADKVPGGQK